MFSIERKEATVTIWVNTGCGAYSIVSFNHCIGDKTQDVFAELLLRHIEKMFSDRVREIRRKSYETGWDDHKKKNCKKTLFSECFDSNDVGWSDD